MLLKKVLMLLWYCVVILLKAWSYSEKNNCKGPFLIVLRVRRYKCQALPSCGHPDIQVFFTRLWSYVQKYRRTKDQNLTYFSMRDKYYKYVKRVQYFLLKWFYRKSIQIVSSVRCFTSSLNSHFHLARTESSPWHFSIGGEVVLLKRGWFVWQMDFGHLSCCWKTSCHDDSPFYYPTMW